MIKDTKGRKWFMRFRQYRNGWHWEAQHGNAGREAGETFRTKALAEDDARRSIQSFNSIAAGESTSAACSSAAPSAD